MSKLKAKAKNSKGKKKFKVRVKPKNPQVDPRPGAAGSGGNRPPRSFEDSLIDYVGARELPEVSNKYLAICGAARPIDEANAGNRSLMSQFDQEVASALQKHFEVAPSSLGVQVSRLAVRPGDAAVISVAELKKLGGEYRAAEVDVIAGVRLSPVPRSGPTPAIAIDLVALIWGPEARYRLEGRRRKRPPRGGIARSAARWIASEDIEAVKAAVSGVFSPSFTELPDDDLSDDEDVDIAEQAEPGFHALLTLMARSQLPLRNALFALGAGKPIVAGALAQVEHSLKVACKAEREILHRDEIAHFWFSELRRLGLDHISVPVVKLR